MNQTMELQELISLFEKEGMINNKLKQREQELNNYKNDIDKHKIKNLEKTNNHLTLKRGSSVLIERVKNHRLLVKNLYLAHKIVIHILVFIIIVILFFKIVNN